MDDKNPLKMKVSELKAELGRRGLGQTGLKFDLAQRLQTAMDVDEFGALPSMTCPSQSSSSPLLPVPGNDSPPHCEQTPSCESAQGGPSDEQAQDLEMAAETNGSEAAPTIEHSCLGDASIVADATQSEGGAPPSTVDILTSEEEKLRCGEKGRDQSKANSDGSDNNLHDGVGVEENKSAASGGGHVEHQAAAGVGGSNEKADVGGSNKQAIDAEECSAAATTNEESPLLSFGSQDGKNSGTEENVRSGEDTSLIVQPDSINLASAPASPPKGTEQVAREDKDQPAAGAEERDGKATRREGAKTDDPEQKKAGAKADTTDDDVKADTTDDDVNQEKEKNKEETKEEPSGFAPDSLLLFSLAERMKDREERFRQGNNSDDKKENKSEAKGRTGDDNPGPTEASGHRHGGKIGSSSSASGQGGLPSVGGACQQAHGAQTVEDVRRAKLMKRKERFMAPPSSGSSNGQKPSPSSLAKLGTLLAKCSSRMVPEGVLGEGTSGLTISRRQTANKVAAKMAKRSERFGVKGAGSSVIRQVNPAEVRDPRGSFFAESEHTPGGGNTEQPQPPPSAGYSFDPLPQRQKRARARATTASVSSSLHDSDGTPAKRRGVDRGVAGGPERAASPGVVVARNNNDKVKAAKTAERMDVRFQLAGRKGIGESRGEETGKPSPPSSSCKRVSLGSTFVLLGVKKPKPAGPKLSTTATAAAAAAAAAGKRKESLPPRLSRGGDETNGASNHPPERLGKEGKKAKKQQTQQRDGLVGKNVAEQAAKMAERRKRFAEDPRAPSFR